MSVHAEWFDAAHTSVEVAVSGEEVCSDTVSAPLALALSANEVAVVEGSAEQLRAILRRALAGRRRGGLIG